MDGIFLNEGEQIDQIGLWPIRSQVAGTSSYCLDVPGASAQAGLGVQIYRCNNTAAQAWAIAGPVT